MRQPTRSTQHRGSQGKGLTHSRLSCPAGPSGTTGEEVPRDARSPGVLTSSLGGARGGAARGAGEAAVGRPTLPLSTSQMVPRRELASDALAGPPFLAQFTEPRGAGSLRLGPAVPRRPAAQPRLMEPGWVSPREQPEPPASGEGTGDLSRHVSSSTPAPQTPLHTPPHTASL